MRLVIQRVESASVKIDNKKISSIRYGYVIFVGIGKGDTEQDIDKCIDKIKNLRIMSDKNNKMNRDILETKGEVLVISQFTLYADLSSRRPDFMRALNAKEAKALYDRFILLIRKEGILVKTGVFGAMMKVELINDGPVTIIYDTKENK